MPPAKTNINAAREAIEAPKESVISTTGLVALTARAKKHTGRASHARNVSIVPQIQLGG